MTTSARPIERGEHLMEKHSARGGTSRGDGGKRGQGKFERESAWEDRHAGWIKKTAVSKTVPEGKKWGGQVWG
jgi:hypothetical protein